MKKKNDPPDYPGDEAVNKAFGDALRELRIERGLSEEEVDALLRESERVNPYPRLYRALGIVVRQLREKRKMSRAQLSSVSGLRLRFITSLERGRVSDATVTQIVRLAMTLRYSPADFVELVLKQEKELRSE